MRSCVSAIACCSLVAASVPDDSLAALKKDVQAIVDASSAKYNCSFSVAVKNPGLGLLSWDSGDGLTEDSRFAWGSITKMWTGASIMQLVAEDTLELEQKIAPVVDAQLKLMKEAGFPGMTNWSTLEDLYGPEVAGVTLHNLLHMQSGIPDFDTANPSRHGPDLDPFRATVYAEPTHSWVETTLMSEPWVAQQKLASVPGKGFHYSTTNFGILGLILANKAGHSDYRKFDQSTFLPAALLAKVSKDIDWAVSGTPRDHGVVAGFDRTDYNGQDPVKNPGGVSVVDVAGVFAGYSGADFVGSPSAVAEMGYALWGSTSELVPKEFRDLMVPDINSTDFVKSFYGLASQNVGLMGITGGSGHPSDPLSVAYGHLGATYGYDSIYGYNPTLDSGIAVATNIETAGQVQPADAFCGVYNRVKNFMLKEPVQNCTYVTSGYYGGKCNCTSL
jgi:CubicO group peptidase (beta-lactamase class C family)